MSRSHGSGYPLNFMCPVARSIILQDHWEERRRRNEHEHHLTGQMRPTKRNGKGHPRKSWMTFQWTCSCGATGWSSHHDLERMAIKDGLIEAEDERLRSYR